MGGFKTASQYLDIYVSTILTFFLPTINSRKKTHSPETKLLLDPLHYYLPRRETSEKVTRVGARLGLIVTTDQHGNWKRKAVTLLPWERGREGWRVVLGGEGFLAALAALYLQLGGH